VLRPAEHDERRRRGAPLRSLLSWLISCDLTSPELSRVGNPALGAGAGPRTEAVTEVSKFVNSTSLPRRRSAATRRSIVDGGAIRSRSPTTTKVSAAPLCPEGFGVPSTPQNGAPRPIQAAGEADPKASEQARARRCPALVCRNIRRFGSRSRPFGRVRTICNPRAGVTGRLRLLQVHASAVSVGAPHALQAVCRAGTQRCTSCSNASRAKGGAASPSPGGPRVPPAGRWRLRRPAPHGGGALACPSRASSRDRGGRTSRTRATSACSTGSPRPRPSCPGPR
jgi:hypothetical protein